MKQITFYRAIKQHCIDQKADCLNCCLRLYCYTPPCEQTDSMMEKVISFLDTANIRTEGHNHSDHYICVRLPKCPLDVDMTGTLGYEQGG